MIGCCSDSAALCHRCVDDLFACLRGVAMCRADSWARSVAVRHPRHLELAWPRTDRAHQLALKRVEDLARDPTLRERLANVVIERVAQMWRELGFEFGEDLDPDFSRRKVTTSSK